MSAIPGAVGGAYGAGKAGVQFDLLVFIRKRSVILRLMSLVSIIAAYCVNRNE